MSTDNSLTRVARAYQSEEEPERIYTLAGTYWRLMLLVGALIAITAVAAGAYMLLTTFAAISFTGSQTATTQTLNRQQLSTVVQGLVSRQMRFEEITKSPPTIVDPSK
jgi:hypothetical protein